MSAPLVLQVGSRSGRSPSKCSLASTRIARITYCETEDRWTGLPGALGRKLREDLQAREPWFLALGLKERVAYAGLVGAAAIMRAGFAGSVLILPLDWTSDPEAEPADLGGHLPVGSTLAFAMMQDLAPLPAGSEPWNMFDGPVAYVADAEAASSFIDAVDALLQTQGGGDAVLEKVLVAWALQGRAGVFRQRLVITPENLGAWRDASPAQVDGAFFQSETPSVPFRFNRYEHRVVQFAWQRPEFSDYSGRNPRLRDRLRSAFAAKVAVDDPLRGSADPISGAEQAMLRQYLKQAKVSAAPGWKDEFVRWMLAADPSTGGASRIESSIYAQRPDMQAAFPRQSRDLSRLLRQWFIEWGLTELGICLIGRGDLESGSLPRGVAPRGDPLACDVHVVGYLNSVLGLGTSAQNQRDALELAGVSIVSTPVPLPGTPESQAPASRVPVDCRVTLLVVNGDYTRVVSERLDARSLRNSHRIGVWAWELPEVPPRMLGGIGGVDELWVPSAFVRDAFRPHTRKPITVVPHPVWSVGAEAPGGDDPPPREPYFFFAFDYNSTIERKNPGGLIDAFTSAFADGSGPHLVIKTLNAGGYAEQHEQLLGRALRRKDIHLVDGMWPRGLVHRTIRDSLAVVSLHRSEGFGFLLAEAMSWSRPTIATGYSGNLEFQHPGNALLVGYKPARVASGCSQYDAGGTWAEPDVDDAAKAMRAVFRGGSDIDALARAGAQTVRERLAPEVVGRRMKELLLRHVEPGDRGATFIRQWRRLLGS